jgi:rubredoxin
LGQTYSRYVISEYVIDIVDKGGGHGARPLTPISLARDFVDQQKRYERGGVFCYLGDHLPGENPDKRKALEELQMLEKARKELIAYYDKRIQKANSEWVKPNKQGLLNIDDLDRLAARYLMHWKFLKSEPPWLTQLRSEMEVASVCPKCRVEVNVGAAECKVCGYVLDPKALYELGEIDEEHHALRRLSRETLDSMGLKHVPTLAQARKQKSEAKPK